MGRATDYSGESHRGLQSVGRSYPCPLCYLDRLTVLAGNLLNEIDDAAPKLGFVDPDESLCQQEPFGAGKEIRHIGRRGCVFHSVGRTVQVGRALVEERYWHLKDMGDLLQPAGPDAVGAFLVFLHLLEGEAKCGTQLFLAHCKHNAAHAQSIVIFSLHAMPKSRFRESAQGDKWSFCLTAGKIGPRIRREHEQETAPEPHIGL